MDGFEIRVGLDFVRVQFEEVCGFPDKTSYNGGYDVRGRVDIQRGPYRAYGSLWFSTGNVWQFYTELRKAYNDLAGEARFRSSEGQLKLAITFRSRGQLIIEGMYRENFGNSTQLLFEIKSDQSYLIEPLAQLAAIVARYGDMHGVRKR